MPIQPTQADLDDYKRRMALQNAPIPQPVYWGPDANAYSYERHVREEQAAQRKRELEVMAGRGGRSNDRGSARANRQGDIEALLARELEMEDWQPQNFGGAPQPQQGGPTHTMPGGAVMPGATHGEAPAQQRNAGMFSTPPGQAPAPRRSPPAGAVENLMGFPGEANDALMEAYTTTAELIPGVRIPSADNPGPDGKIYGEGWDNQGRPDGTSWVGNRAKAAARGVGAAAKFEKDRLVEALSGRQSVTSGEVSPPPSDYGAAFDMSGGVTPAKPKVPNRNSPSNAPPAAGPQPGPTFADVLGGKAPDTTTPELPGYMSADRGARAIGNKDFLANREAIKTRNNRAHRGRGSYSPDEATEQRKTAGRLRNKRTGQVDELSNLGGGRGDLMVALAGQNKQDLSSPEGRRDAFGPAPTVGMFQGPSLNDDLDANRDTQMDRIRKRKGAVKQYRADVGGAASNARRLAETEDGTIEQALMGVPQSAQRGARRAFMAAQKEQSDLNKATELAEANSEVPPPVATDQNAMKIANLKDVLSPESGIQLTPQQRDALTQELLRMMDSSNSINNPNSGYSAAPY